MARKYAILTTHIAQVLAASDHLLGVLGLQRKETRSNLSRFCGGQRDGVQRDILPWFRAAAAGAGRLQFFSERQMNVSIFLRRCVWAAMAVCAASSLLSADSVYITGWAGAPGGSGTGGNNIYTNLDQEFPNTGAGAPGSEVGVPNASYIYNPATYTSASFVAGSNSNAVAGINFDITSNATGQDFEQLYNGASLSINAASFNVNSPTAVYLLTAEYFGGSYSVTFTGSGGASETFSVGVPDFCNGGVVNSSSGGVTNASILEVQNTGACGSGNSATGYDTSYFLYEQGFTLNSSFAGQSLTGIDVTNTGGATLVLGATASEPSAAVGTAPEPASGLLLLGPLAGLGFLWAKRTIRNGRTQ